MASLIPGFEYDIFISYRQKDNKHDAWVTEFVNNLKGELESTFKEEISVYFDINPHDGLLETHDVDASLQNKLKCLILIPIISHTYCDPKSFAWEHEFKAFIKQASSDKLGLKVKLPNGNVASRILPVHIHELDSEDKVLIEGEIGGVLRGVEFIYRSAGVNRPMRANEDHPHDNLNKTYYRDQINKVANAVKEIINAIKRPDQPKITDQEKVPNLIIEKSKSSVQKILAISLSIIALAIAGYFLIPKLTLAKRHIEKSLAILPFINDSPDQENAYFINGIMEEILTNLQTIRDIRVLSRTSTEQYRGSNKSIPEIAKELGVNYLVEGSGQKYGDNFRLRVQLISTRNEKHLWGGSFGHEIKVTKDIFDIQNQIAQNIASELKATITPEETKIIERTATESLKAYEFYRRGKEEYLKGSLDTAETLYREALEYDSKFAQTYAGLARIYWSKYYWKTYFSKNFLDSVLILANIALRYDDKLSEAYTIRGDYYTQVGKTETAIEEYDKATQLNPNDWSAYYGKGWIYSYRDLVRSIDNFHKAASLYHGEKLPTLLRALGKEYNYAGFSDKSYYYWNEALRLNGDSARYFYDLSGDAANNGNFRKAAEYAARSYSMDTTQVNFILLYLAMDHLFLGNYEVSLNYVDKYLEKINARNKATGIRAGSEIYGIWIIGYIYWKNGYIEEADYYFNETIKNWTRAIELNREIVQEMEVYYDLAAVYAFRGEKDKAYENLQLFNQKKISRPWLIILLKNDPLFDSIRNEPDFQQVLRDTESKFQAEHEKVKEWLKETGQL